MRKSFSSYQAAFEAGFTLFSWAMLHKETSDA